MFRALANELAVDFQQNPINYVTEADLQIALVELLRSELSPIVAATDDVTLEGTSDTSFKRDYWQTLQAQLTKAGSLDRVHAEVSVQQGERLDVAVFQPELTQSIEWVAGGSKRFNERDIECVYELKFVKNKTSFPKHTGYPVAELADTDLSVEQLLQRADSDDPLLDFEENKLQADIQELNRLETVDERFLLLFANNNYLYHDPTLTETTAYRYGELYHRMGKAAREWMGSEANSSVNILYVHPRGQVWLT